MKVLIVKLGAFGDIVHCLPALQDVLNHPEVSEVHWLVDQCYADVVALLPAQVQCHHVQLKKPRKIGVSWQIVRSLRQKKFDVVLDLQGLLKSGLLARLVSGNAYGFDRLFSPEKGNALLVKPVHFHADEKHVVQQYRRIVSVISPTQSAAFDYVAPHIAMTGKLQIIAQDVLYGLRLNNFVLMHLGGGWETKKLPSSTWLILAEKIADAGFTPVYSWGNREEQVLAYELADQSYAVILPQRLDMLRLAGLLSGAKAVIGADTGLIHLAAAMGTPTASFWGPSASWRSAPQGTKHIHAESNPSCGPCFKRSCVNFICMDAIVADDLLRVLNV
ncbi:MAG: glycosyltransferase family 9 protein [Mariprofundaceae bacterium]|nr:glycosyltransferase family 9 protein [Mariprofundaceae bacterium]